jgi:hypothetical protein
MEWKTGTPITHITLPTYGTSRACPTFLDPVKVGECISWV